MKKILLIISIILIASVNTATATPHNPLTIAGYVKDVHGNNIGNVVVYAKNLATNEIMTNASDLPVTSTEGYQIQLGNLPSGWNVGDAIAIYGWYYEGGQNYSGSRIEIIPNDIILQGSIITATLNLNNPEGNVSDDDDDDDDNDDTPGPEPDGRKHDTFTTYGIITNSENNVIINATVNIHNTNTEDYITCQTNNTGIYSADIGTLAKGWQINDMVKVNVTHNNEYGYFKFKIRYGQTAREINIETVQTVIPSDDDDDDNNNPGIPATYAGMWDLYNTTKSSLTNMQNQMDTKDIQIADLNTEINNLNTTINDLKNKPAESGGFNWYATSTAVLLVIALFFIYSWWKTKQMLIMHLNETGQKPKRTLPILKRTRR